MGLTGSSRLREDMKMMSTFVNSIEKNKWMTQVKGQHPFSFSMDLLFGAMELTKKFISII